VVLDAILLKAALNFYASRAETELMLDTCALLTVLTKTQAPKYLHLLRERDAWPILMGAWRDLKGILFYCIVFCFVLFCIVFCFVLFCFVLFCFVLFCFVLFYFVLFCFVLFCFVLFCFVFVLFCFVLFCFVLFCFVVLFVCLFACLLICLFVSTEVILQNFEFILIIFSGSLAASVLGNLVSALVTFSVLAGGDLAAQLLADIAVPLNSRLAALVSHTGQTTQVISESLCVLDGICKAGNGRAGEWVRKCFSLQMDKFQTVLGGVHSFSGKLKYNQHQSFL
jgi:hypothetical protein